MVFSPGVPAAPPYMPFSTFLELVNRLEQEGVPPWLDRAYLSASLGATSSAHALTTLRFLGLVDEHGVPTDALRDLVLGDRRQRMASLVRVQYAPLFNSLQIDQAGKEELDLALRRQYHINGDTLRRARTFFVKAAQFAAIPLSHTITEHTRNRGTLPPRPRVSRPVQESASESQPMPEAATMPQVAPQRSEQTMMASPEAPSDIGTQTEDVKMLKLRSAGTVTLTLAVPLFEVDKRDRAFIFDLVDMLVRYERGQLEGNEPEPEGLPATLPPRV